jgi:hypothetical protein
MIRMRQVVIILSKTKKRGIYRMAARYVAEAASMDSCSYKVRRCVGSLSMFLKEYFYEY